MNDLIAKNEGTFDKKIVTVIFFLTWMLKSVYQIIFLKFLLNDHSYDCESPSIKIGEAIGMIHILFVIKF